MNIIFNVIFWIITIFLVLNGIFFGLGSLPIIIGYFDPIGASIGLLSLVWSIFRIRKFKRMKNDGYTYIREYGQYLKAKDAGFDSSEAYDDFKEKEQVKRKNEVEEDLFKDFFEERK